MNKEEQIIDPIPKDTLLRELATAEKLRTTSKGSNEIYLVTAKDQPNVMQEIGRLRELSFRNSGGGTGKSVDIDEDDTAENGYKQLIVFDPESNDIVGGYRFIVSYNEHPAHLSTEHYFNFSEKFREEFLPRTIELGRSFVQPKYQNRTGSKKSIYSLDNLWDGLGALVRKYPHVNYFFGKVTMYLDYNEEAAVKLFAFLDKYFQDSDNLMKAIEPRKFPTEKYDISGLFTGGSFEEDYKILVKELRRLGETIPPMFNVYMNLSPTMRVFGTMVNPDFGYVQETGILVTISDIYKDKYDRYVNSGYNDEQMHNDIIEHNKK